MGEAAPPRWGFLPVIATVAALGWFGSTRAAQRARRLRSRAPDLRPETVTEDTFPAALLDTLVHELRTPITSIRSLSRALAVHGSPLDARGRREALELVQLHTEHLAGMLEDVRSLGAAARAEAHAGPIGSVAPALTVVGAARGRAVTLAQLVRVAAHAARLPAEHLAYADAGEARGPVTDPVRLQRILTNVLENAVRHGSPGGRVDLDVRHRGDWLQIAVGNGVTATRPSAGAGSGLGLSIVESLVVSVGGRVHHREHEGRFEIDVLLPLAAVRGDVHLSSRGPSDASER